MKNWPFRIGFVVIGVIIAIIYWQFYRPAEQPAEQAITPPPASTIQAPAAIQHPVVAQAKELEAAEPIIAQTAPLPALNESDSPMAEVLAKLFADQKLERFFLFEHFIERFVVMVDNLPRQQLPATHRPVKKISGTFLTQGPRDQLSIDPANYLRYTPLIKMLAALDSKQVVAVYKRLYPLFQEAYQGLGYPNGYFNDRLIEVIDHLLSAPQVAGPVYLVQPKALYLYADPALEALSAGRKILLRIGPDQAAQLKTLLREYRLELASDS